MNIRNKNIPGRVKPQHLEMRVMADEAAEIARSIDAQPWRRLAMSAALTVAQAKGKPTAAKYLAIVHGYAEKNRRHGKKALTGSA